VKQQLQGRRSAARENDEVVGAGVDAGAVGTVRHLVTILLALWLTLFVYCGSASAARPPSAARYLLPLREEIGLAAQEGTLQVSGDGRWLLSDGLPRFSPVHVGFSPVGISSSYVETLLSCTPNGEVFDAYFNLARPPHGRLAIDAHGRFRTVVRADSSNGPDKATIRVRGQFLSGGRALVSIVAGRYHPYHARSCRVPHRRFTFRLRPLPPFPSCRGAPGQTIAATNGSRVYTHRGLDELGRARYAYACLDGGRQIVLGRAFTNNDYGTLDVFRLAASYVAYREDVAVEGSPADDESLTVVDLSGFGTIARTVDDAVPDPNGYIEWAASFEQFVLTTSGSLAWVASYCRSDATTCAQFPSNNYDVWISDGSGTRSVDSGQRIDPKSLKLNGSTVTWTNAGVARGAPIDALSPSTAA
jgi:hypothetical protein